ncbi:MAG TPA: hypothetical protein VLG09_02590 [Candidatus Saccharimonadales bacterium]|nr:hypothetical protein [Candidatus Saccharimonadales bacterium]
MTDINVTFIYETMDDLYALLKRKGLGEIGTDNDGQLVIYTGLKDLGISDNNVHFCEVMEG